MRWRDVRWKCEVEWVVKVSVKFYASEVVVITRACDFGLRQIFDCLDFTTHFPATPLCCLSYLTSTFSLTFVLCCIFPICSKIIHVFAMLAFMHWALRLLLCLAPIVPGTFVARQDAPDIYKQCTMTWTLASLNRRTTMHLHRCRLRSQVPVDLSTRIHREMMSNLRLHLHPNACHILLLYLITISTWMSTLLVLIRIMHPGLMLTPNLNRAETLHHLGVSRLLTLRISLESIILQSMVRDAPLALFIVN